MILFYRLDGYTADRKKIGGSVFIDSTADIANRLSYTILSFNAYCEGTPYCGCTGNTGSIQFHMGPPGSNTVTTANAIWEMGEWSNAGTGVWFRNADGSRYETDANLGKLDFYKHLPPKIELCADMVEQGPFIPHDRMWLTWDSQL